MIKLFASDLDGTLLNPLHQVDPLILAALRRVTDAGLHFSIATGRTLRTPAEFGFTDIPAESICANGSLIFDCNGQLIHHSTIDPAFLEELLRTFPHIWFDCVGTECSYVTCSNEHRLAGVDKGGPIKRLSAAAMKKRQEQQLASYKFEVPIDEILRHEICKVNTSTKDPALKRELQAFLDDHADSVVNAPFNPVMFEITSANVNKGEAIAWLANYLGFTEDEVAVYGDGGNDIAMLERFEHAYATANGSDGAKQAAGNTIGSNNSYAVPRHMLATVHRQQTVRDYTIID